MKKLAFLDAPQENLQTWSMVTKLLGYGSAATAILLLLIAADWRRGVKRSAFWVVTILLGVMHLGFWTFARTEGWLTFCQWYADLP